MKYREDETIKVVQDYISSTYRSHYSNEEKDVQTLDLLEAIGSAEHFCQSNIIKYASRYKKKNQHKQDVLKIIHYAILLYYFSGTTYPEDKQVNSSTPAEFIDYD
tara:strand:+ start:420 stop:734 length:315 start_codon:yes stop_codon:yes gene_type:complete